jgi:hypothetical protein
MAEKNNTSIGVPGAQVYYTVHNVTTDDCRRGVNQLECLVRAACMQEIVTKTGGWHQWGTELGVKSTGEPLKYNGEALFNTALMESGKIELLRTKVMAKAWEKASQGRLIIDRLVVSQATGQLMAASEVDGEDVVDAGKIFAPINMETDPEETGEATYIPHTGDEKIDHSEEDLPIIAETAENGEELVF